MRIAREKFIADIAGYVKKYAGLYGILVYSPVIAQAVLESGWGESRLSSQYHNYFGLKCGTRWTGRSVNMRTQEEYREGTLTSIRADGYATSFSYVEDCMKVIRQYELTRFDEGGCETMAKTAESVLDVMRGWLGFSEANGKFKEIIDLYNSVKPLPRGYAVQYSDEWCDACVSAAGIKAGCSELIGRECGVEEHVKIFKKLGIWIEDGTITPEPGYVIVYNWDKAAQPNDGYSDHIGFVENVSGGMITAIEGNRGEKVDRRVIPLGWGYIRGYAAPQYEKAVKGTGGNPGTGKKSVEAVAKEVIAGKWGNGEDRKKRLQAAGYDYPAVQRKVNGLMR